jgi:hypothetical protein
MSLCPIPSERFAPEHFSTDARVQAFIEAALRDFSNHATPRELIDFAFQKFGPRACWDAGVWPH